MFYITFNLCTIANITRINHNCPPTITVITIVYYNRIRIAYI